MMPPTIKGESMQTPLMFACASRVKMPQVGSDESSVKPLKRPIVTKPMHSKPANHVSKGYIKKISADLTFSDDVVKDRCFHLMPYDSKYLKDTFNTKDIVPTLPKPKGSSAGGGGRYNHRGSDKRHLPCHIQNRVEYKLKPLKRRILLKAREMHKDAIEKQQIEALQAQDSNSSTGSSIFLTDISSGTPREFMIAPPQQPPQKEWDYFLMSELSQNTAQWIVKARTEPGERQEGLMDFLRSRYGQIGEGNDLIKDSASEAGDMDDREDDGTARKWKKHDENLLDRVRALTLAAGKPTDPYADDTQAAFYRLPAGFRRAKKHRDKEEEELKQKGAINSTAYNIEVKRWSPPPPETLKDYLNPQVGDKFYDTENTYQQDRLKGGQLVYHKYEDKDKLITADNNRYRKQVQSVSPRKPNDWFPEPEEDSGVKAKVEKVGRGMRRWKGLPQPIDDTGEKLKLVAPVMGPSKTPDHEERKAVRNNDTLVQIVTDWRNKWHLDMRYVDASPDDLIRDMADIHPHIKLKAITTCARAQEYYPTEEELKHGYAITTCARAAEYRPPEEMGIQLQKDQQHNPVKLLPENLFIGLQCCLDDQHEQVRRAAAIALYTLERPVPKAEDILRDTLKEERSVDRWTAAQCLAYYGECDSEVVGELVWQLLNTDDNVKIGQAEFLLAKLSENSTLVHSMIAEKLNSSSWRHRVIACKILPKLYGHVSKDIVHKLVYIMWSDWHKEVRVAAAQTLGRTGHGKDVHDELREKILNGNERTRVEAINKIGYLGIMTAKLLPVFLTCFHDEYVSVRQECCVACSNLKIEDDSITEKLIYLATYDPIWKIKALALQSLGIIGLCNDKVVDCVVWAFRYEENAGVRAEACHTITVLQINDSAVAQHLQDRYLVETSDVVRDEIKEALKMFDISPSEDMDMVAQVKGEVRKLCNKTNIAAQITLNEKEEDDRENRKRMISLPEEEKKKEVRIPRPTRPFSEMSKHSSLGSRPVISVTSDGDTPRAHSPDTNVTEKEIADLFQRRNITPEGGSYVDTRSESGFSQKSKYTDALIEEDEEDDEEVIANEELRISINRLDSASKGTQKATPPQNKDTSQGIPQIVATPPEEDKPVNKSTTPVPEIRVLSVDQSYVEVNPEGEGSNPADGVVSVTHEDSAK